MTITIKSQAIDKKSESQHRKSKSRFELYIQIDANFGEI